MKTWKKLGILVMALVMVVSLIVGSIFAFSPDTGLSTISLQQPVC